MDCKMSKNITKYLSNVDNNTHHIFFIRRQYYLNKVQVGVVGGIFFV
jgi:hypothetical protein